MGAAQPVTGVGDGRLGKSMYELERESEADAEVRKLARCSR